MSRLPEALMEQEYTDGCIPQAAIAALIAQVQQTIGVEQSALALIQGLPAVIQAAVAGLDTGTAAAVTAAFQPLIASASSLAAAVAANPLPPTS